jgi:hypothetical protein
MIVVPLYRVFEILVIVTNNFLLHPVAEELVSD